MSRVYRNNPARSYQLQDAYREGIACFYAGKDLMDCPYREVGLKKAFVDGFTWARRRPKDELDRLFDTLKDLPND